MNPRRISQGIPLLFSSKEAKALLRSRHLRDEWGVWPLEVLEVLIAAYPEAQLPEERDGEPGGTDWRVLAIALARDFVPAFRSGGAPGRPPSKVDGLVRAVDELVCSGEANSITHACRILQKRGQFHSRKDLRKAYYDAGGGLKRKKPVR